MKEEEVEKEKDEAVEVSTVPEEAAIREREEKKMRMADL